MIRKITSKNKSNKHVHIKTSQNIHVCSRAKDISNALGENFQKKTLLVQIIPKTFRT